MKTAKELLTIDSRSLSRVQLLWQGITGTRLQSKTVFKLDTPIDGADTICVSHMKFGDQYMDSIFGKHRYETMIFESDKDGNILTGEELSGSVYGRCVDPVVLMKELGYSVVLI